MYIKVTMTSISNMLLRKSLVAYASIRNVRQARRNPGIHHQQKLIFQNEPVDPQVEDFEDFEADFQNLGLSHKQHEKEMERMLEKEKLHIVKRKYFKEEKLPNFLTWADKKQIKYLHGKDKDEWTCERLAEGFPATEDIIKKILKANYTKKNEKKICNHDENVRRNWDDFKNGKLPQLPEHLKRHLNKFTTRSLNFDHSQVPETKTIINLPKGEFYEIIASYERLKNNSANTQLIEAKKPPKDDKQLKETYVIKEDFKVKEPMTFNQYRSELMKKEEGLTEDDKLIIETVDVTNDVAVKPDYNLKKYEKKTVHLSTVKKEKDYSHLEYPEKIVIPEEKRRRGNIYKLNDCYYDDDGEFLYRVPGMY